MCWEITRYRLLNKSFPHILKECVECLISMFRSQLICLAICRLWNERWQDIITTSEESVSYLLIKWSTSIDKTSVVFNRCTETDYKRQMFASSSLNRWSLLNLPPKLNKCAKHLTKQHCLFCSTFTLNATYDKYFYMYWYIANPSNLNA